MLLNESKPFNSPDYLFELKLDGIRAILYIDKDKVTIQNKRGDEIIERYPELKQASKYTNCSCVLDGEIICMTNGMPDFAKLQRRALLTNKLRIHLMMKSCPVQFVAYDILQKENKILIDLPLIKRKDILNDIVTDSDILAKSRYIFNNGKDFFNLTKQQGLEGIVAKKIDSLYVLGKRSKEWLKIKALNDEDFLICGYKLNDNGKIKDVLLLRKLEQNNVLINDIKKNILFGLKKTIKNYNKKQKQIIGVTKQTNVKLVKIKCNDTFLWSKVSNKPYLFNCLDNYATILKEKTFFYFNMIPYQYCGSVALGINESDSNFLIKYAKNHSIDLPIEIKEAHFVEPKYYCTVVYMLETRRGHLRQPIYKGLRSDR